MNRHARRAAAATNKKAPTIALESLQNVLEQLRGLEIPNAPQALTELSGMVQGVSDNLTAMDAELKLHRSVLPRLLAELTGRQVSEVVALEAALLATAAAEGV